MEFTDHDQTEEKILYILLFATGNIAQVYTKASLSGGFISQFATYPYFGNSAEEFHPHETLSTPMKFLSSLFIKTMSCQHI